jgi:16S rRNA (uracil1498-N3)-methyltransferase
MSFKESLELIKDLDILLVPYENKRGMQDTIDALSLIKKGMKVGIYIGAEGGFDQTEIQTLMQNNAKIISLGKRILRTETASITAISMLMLHAESYL